MREYLIRQINDEDFFIPFQNWKDVLVTSAFESRVVQENGRFYVQVENCKIYFSPEPPGLQISFSECFISEEIANQITEEILTNIESFTGEKGKIIPI
jgi:hypothetical protein